MLCCCDIVVLHCVSFGSVEQGKGGWVPEMVGLTPAAGLDTSDGWMRLCKWMDGWMDK